MYVNMACQSELLGRTGGVEGWPLRAISLSNNQPLVWHAVVLVRACQDGIAACGPGPAAYGAVPIPRRGG